MHPEVAKAPTSLAGRNIAGINIQFHLVLAIAKLHSCTVMPFVHIFVNVLDGLDRGNAFHIDMAAVIPDKPFGVWYNPKRCFRA